MPKVPLLLPYNLSPPLPLISEPHTPLTLPPAKGLGASTAPAAKQQSAPGEAPVASDSGNTNVGVDASANNRGEKGIGGPTVS
jgi:hypothetical protein